jgi:hypothetical protein
MAKKDAGADAQAAAAAELRAERAETTAINNAIAGTEDEIFTDAMGDEPLDLDGDRKLEAMADDIGDEDADPDADEAEGEDELEDDALGDSEVDTEVDPDAQEVDEGVDAQGQGDQREDDQGRVPAGRFREISERAREAQGEADDLRYRLQVAEARINDLVTMGRQPQPQPINNGQQQAQPQQRQDQATPPDMFADPDGWQQWVVDQADRRAEARIREGFGGLQRQQAAIEENRIQTNMEATASGPNGWLFQEAFRQLTSLERNRESAAIVTEIISDRDPGGAVLEWFEETGRAEQFMGSVAQQLGIEPAPQRGRPQQEPRREYRLPQSMQRRQPPSLNEARGGLRRGGMDADPRGFDGTEQSIADYAFAR